MLRNIGAGLMHRVLSCAEPRRSPAAAHTSAAAGGCSAMLGSLEVQPP